MHSDKITVIVASHNSSKTIARTIQSIARQSYREIQIIIADDHSRDDTVSVASAELKKYQDSFSEDSVMLQSDEWLGTVSNIRRALCIANGRWVKLIAADDVLFDKCLDVLSYQARNHLADIVFSAVEIINEDDTPSVQKIKSFELAPILLRMPKRIQMFYLSRRNILPAPGIFLITGAAVRIFSMIEQKLIEDWPLWMEALNSNMKIVYLEEKLVGYRVHQNQVTRSDSDEKKSIILNDIEKFILKYRRIPLAPVAFKRRNRGWPALGVSLDKIKFFALHMLLKLLALLPKKLIINPQNLIIVGPKR